MSTSWPILRPGKEKILMVSDINGIAVRAKNGDESAKKELYEAMKGEIDKIALSYSRAIAGGECYMDDYRSEASYGLFLSLESFDASKGSFWAYSIEAMRMAIRAFISNNQDMIRCPKHITEKLSKIRKANEKLEVEGIYEPTCSELASASGLTETAVKNALRAKQTQSVFSLDYRYFDSDDDSLSLLDLLESKQSIEEDFLDSYFESFVGKCLLELPEREKVVLGSEFGAFGIERRSVKELSSLYNVTTTTIRNWRIKAQGMLLSAAGF